MPQNMGFFREIALLEKCDKAAMVGFVSKIIRQDNSARRKLSCQVVGSSVAANGGDELAAQNVDPNDKVYEFKYHQVGNDFIEKMEDFKSTLTLFPVHHINQ